MKRFILTLFILTSTSYISYSQKLEDIGAGVIDFLLRNPKTANKMNSTETVALDIIGDLLKTESQRKYQLEYATAGRNQIMINSNDGRQAQFVKNEQGKIFLLVDGIVYPIAQELVNEASGNKTTTGQNNISFAEINTTEIENWINKPEIIRYKEPYYVSSGGEYVSQIISNTDTPQEYIGDENYNALQKKYQDNKIKLPPGTKLTIGKAYYKNSVCSPIMFKWARDLDGSGSMSFDEFKQIKKSFYDNENFNIAIFYNTDKYAEGNLLISLFDSYTGNLIIQDERNIQKNHRGIEYLQISSNQLQVGEYIVNANLVDNSPKSLAANNSNFNIVQGNSSTREMSNDEKNYRTNFINNSTPIGIFFCTSWNDKNKNHKYDFSEFIGLNKDSYSLSSDSLHVSINFPDKFGEIIIQSWTKEGKLVGTTTKQYQRIMTNYINPKSNPYDSMDFIDMVKITGVGEYKITVSFIEGGTYEQKLFITE